MQGNARLQSINVQYPIYGEPLQWKKWQKNKQHEWYLRAHSAVISPKIFIFEKENILCHTKVRIMKFPYKRLWHIYINLTSLTLLYVYAKIKDYGFGYACKYTECDFVMSILQM